MCHLKFFLLLCFVNTLSLKSLFPSMERIIMAFVCLFFLALQSGGLPWLAKHTLFNLQQCGTFCVLQQDCTGKENL